MALENTWSYMHDLGRSLLRPFTSVQRSGALETTGKLSPSEFVEAGDQLEKQSSGLWQWQSTHPSKMDKLLPSDKQYLAHRGIMCHFRANVAATSVQENEDDGTSVLNLPTSHETTAAVPNQDATETRVYDLYITYDVGYATPRFWLCGYLLSTSRPLTQIEIAEDISADHAAKTITMLCHPFLGYPMVSIHPCRHSEIMLKFISEMNEQLQNSSVPQKIPPSMYLIIFLKVLSSVIPTIEYDRNLEEDLPWDSLTH